MPIRESSFRIGCGRYLQGEGLLREAGAEVCRLGHAPLVVGDDTALSLTRDALDASLAASCKKYEIVPHNGTCCEERASQLSSFMAERGLDVVVGVGGGVLMDFAKLIGHFAGAPVLNIPTSSATCAAYTPLSVRYTPDGRTVGSLHYSREVDGVIADTAVIAAQPVRLLLAGVFDALAKFVEIKQRFDGDISRAYPMGLDYARAMAAHSFYFLTEKTDACIADMQCGRITPDVENLIFTTIAATGVISGIARGSNQCALAHKFYEITRFLFHESARPYLHGEIVGVGLLLQNHFNGEEENNRQLRTLMQKYSMPARAADVGIELTDDVFEEYCRRLIASSAIDETDEEECRRLRESMRYFRTL